MPRLPPSAVRCERPYAELGAKLQKRSLGLAVLFKVFPEASDHNEMRVCRGQARTSQVPICFPSLAPLVRAPLIFFPFILPFY